MTTAAARKIRAHRARQPVYMIVRRLTDTETGESFDALVAANQVDARLMRERKLEPGREVRAELKQPRNGAFHRLAHVVGHLLVDNVEGFEKLTAHDAVKRVQREAGVCCESMELDLGPLGKVAVQMPRSIAYDEMDDGEFAELFRGICDHIDQQYLRGLTEAVRQEYLLMTAEQRRAA